VRVESYGPMEATAVLVTRSARVPADVGLLKAPDNRVIVLTPSPDAELPPCEAQVSYLRAPLEEGVRRLRTEHGIASIDCEGGPQLFGDLLRAGLVDELHLVIATKLAGGLDPVTIVTGAPLDPPPDLRVLSLHESGGYLFLRYGLAAG
jgi:riboflavin biosynthesis pyrimidine reductase